MYNNHPEQNLIAVDVDGVVADLHTSWLGRYNNDYNDNLTPKDIIAWAIVDFVKPECGDKILSYLEMPDLYDDTQVISGAYKGLQHLKERGYEVVFVTACNAVSYGAKIKWLKRNNFIKDEDQVIATNQKHLINAAVLVDDRIENCARFPRDAVLFKQPWNIEAPSNYFIKMNNWSEVNRIYRRIRFGDQCFTSLGV